MINVFVTGANGFLATSIIELLLRKGYCVTGYLRDQKKFTGEQHPQLKLVEGTLHDIDLMRQKILECQIIIHTLAITKHDVPSKFDYDPINVEATRTLLALATQASIQTFLYISSANAIGHGTKMHPGTETCAVKKPFLSSKYAQSKIKAQGLVLNWPATFSRIIIAPTFILGSGAYYSASGEIIRRILHKKIICCPPGGKNIVHVDDVADVVLAALEKAPDQSVYLVANENVSYHELCRKVISISGQKSILLHIPRWLMLSIGLCGDAFRRIGFRTNVSYVNMNILCTGNYYIASKAQKELGIQFLSLEHILRDTIYNKR